MRKVAIVCLLLAAAAAVRAQDWCPEGLEGGECATPTTDAACVALTNNTAAWLYSNHTYYEGTLAKSYACTTEGTEFEGSVDKVWMQCFTDVQKCDVHFSLGGNALTCGGLSCSFEDTSVFCSYTKCQCDGVCPLVNGVSLGYMLERLTGTTAISCEQGWPEPACTIDIEGLSATAGGFTAMCKAGECREW